MTNPQTNKALLSCPCCGSNNVLATHPSEPVYCRSCGLRAVDLERWNTRTDHREAILRDALEKATAWFRDYERQHRTEFTTEGNLKADVNADRAVFLEAALNPEQAS